LKVARLRPETKQQASHFEAFVGRMKMIGFPTSQ
jgi:hypothetical protein